MKEIFNLLFVEGHAAIKINDEVIIVDTGFSGSLSYSGSVELCGRRFGGIQDKSHLDDLNNQLSTRVSGLIGGDILSQFGAVEIDYPGCSITFHDTLPDVSDATPIDLSVLRNYLIINMIIDGNERRVVLDTGAPIPYLCSEIAPQRDPDGHVADISFFGPFESPLFTLESEMAGIRFTASYGIPPMQHQNFMRALGCSVVIGKDIFDLGTVIISYAQQRMFLRILK